MACVCLAGLSLALTTLALPQIAPTKHQTLPGESVESHLGAGYDAMKQESYSVAATEFRAALRLDPKLTLRARFPLAAALFELHKPAEARRELEIVRREAGEHPNVLYYLGRLDLEERKLPAAVKNLAKAAEKPPFPDTAYYLGFAYFQQGNLPDAEKWLKEAMNATPHDARVPYQLAQVYRKMGRADEAKVALTQSGELRRRSSNESQLRMECAQKLDQIHENSGSAGSDSVGSDNDAQRAEAHALCEQMYDANDAAKLTALGTIYGSHGDLDAALKPLQRAAELEPESPQSQYNLALVNFQLGRLEEDRAPLAKAVERWPDLFQLNWLYGAVLAKLGEDPAAYAVLEHAHQLNPRDKSTEDLLFLTELKIGRDLAGEQKYNAALRYFGLAAKLKASEASPHEGTADVYAAMGKAGLANAERKTAKRLRE